MGSRKPTRLAKKARQRSDQSLSCSAAQAGENAATLASAILSLKAEQTSVVEKAYYHRYHRRYYHRGYRGITVVITATAIFIAIAGGIKAIATAVGGTKTSTLDNKSEASGVNPTLFDGYRPRRLPALCRQ